jgi:muramidase (phage lysozyme)
MVDLPRVQDRGITAEMATSAVTPGVIEKRADQQASAVSSVADTLMDYSVEQAKKQAADDLIQQKVTRDADGNVQVVNPANSLFFGRAGEAYHAAVKSGTIAQQNNVLSEKLTELHQQYPTSAPEFKAAADAFVQKHAEQVGGELGAAFKQNGAQIATQHYDSIVNRSSAIDVENNKTSIQGQVQQQRDTLTALARQPGGTDSAEFQQALARYHGSLDALGSNPLFKMPADQIALEKKNFAGFLQGEALVAHVDETFNKKGKAEAQKLLEVGIRQNPAIKEVDRNRLYTQGLAHLGYLTQDAKEKIDAGRKDVNELEGKLASNVVKADDPVVGMAVQAARDRGDPESVQRINAAATVQRQFRATNSLPDAIRAEVLGVAPRDVGAVANPDIPAEGRALLNQIARTESGGRYDIRYDGAGGAKIDNFNDHPRVAAPITSGPDVGKTSSAAGRYQFIGTTWDAQAKKLGLKDFSPANQDAAAWDLAQTEYKTRTGKDLLATLKSGNTADVLPSLSGQWSSLPGGRQPAGSRTVAPAANGGPGFTAADAQRNPFLTSAYVRTLASDEEVRVTAAKQTATSIGKALDAGLIPSPVAVAEVNQAAKLHPEKMGAVAEEMNGRLLGGTIAQLPEPKRAEVIDAYKAASDGQDVHHQNVAAAALKQTQDAAKALKDNPYDEAARRGWTNAAPPLDASQPDSIAPALAARAGLSDRIGVMNQMPPPPLLDKDDMPKLQTALQGPAGAGVLTQIAGSLRPEEMKRLLDQKEFADSLTGMMSSKDPARMTSAMSVVDKLWRDNPATAEDKLGKPAITRLQAWQGLKDSFSPQELAERLNAADDPSTLKARQDARDAAEKETTTLKPADMAYKLGTSWGVPIVSWAVNPITGATPAAPFDSIKGGEMVADYRATYSALRAYGVDADKANDLAVKRLGSTWGVSAAAGNQVMKNPPERSYPQVDGSHDWIGGDLNKWIVGKIGPETTAGPRSLEVGFAGVSQNRNWTLAGVISDGQTQAEIAAGKPPSYQVAVKRADGTLDIIPSRIAFDPSEHIAAHESNLRGRKGVADYMRSGQFDNAMPLP